jgi:uncharacterized protein (TIGR03437 family)
MHRSKRVYRLTSVFSLIVIALIAPAPVVDAIGRRAQEAAAAPAVIRTYAGTGIPGASGDGGPALAARLAFPTSVAADGAGNLYIAESSSHRVRKVSPEGLITTVAGNGARGFSGDDGPATAAQLNSPADVAVDAAGNLYIADFGNYRVRRVTPDGVISVYAGNGRTNYGGDGGLAINAGISPTGVALDATGNLYVVDRFNGRVRKVTASTGIITTIAGNGVISGCVCSSGGGISIVCSANGNGGPATEASLGVIAGVAVDRAGILYIAEASGFVRKVTPDGIINPVAGTGQCGYNGDDRPADSAQINQASGLSTDAQGNLYLVDVSNHRIRKVTMSSGMISAVAGNGAPGFSGDGGDPLMAQFRSATDVAIDAAGDLYVADHGNHRVRKVTLPNSVAALTAVSAASFSGGTLASEAIVAAFGVNLAATTQTATSQPLPTSIAGVSVKVRDGLGVERFAPLFLVSPTQINFQIPPGSVNGAAMITVVNEGRVVAESAVRIETVAPGIFTANADGRGVPAAVALARDLFDGSEVYEPVARFDAAQNRFVPAPIDLGTRLSFRQVYLILSGTGWRNAASNVSVRIGGRSAPVTFVGAQGAFTGLDQMNVELPFFDFAGLGEADLELVVDGQVANRVRVWIK